MPPDETCRQTALTPSLLQGGSLPFSKFEFLVMWMFRECGAPYLYLHALLHPAIRWRHLTFRLRWGGRAEAVPREGKEQQVAVDCIKVDQQKLLLQKQLHQRSSSCPIPTSHLIR